MAVSLTGSGGLFTILGKIIHAFKTLNTARGTTVEAEVIDAIDEFENLTNTTEIQAVIESAGVAAAMNSWRENEALASSMSNWASSLIIQMVDDDNPQEDKTLRTALDELVFQMEGSGGETNPDDDVDASAATISVTPDGGNNTDSELAVSVVLGNGRNCELAIAEDLAVTVSSTGGNGSYSIKGEAALFDRLSSQWPKGSGATVGISGVTASSGLLTNGGMDDEDDRTNTPDGWIVETGTIGTTLLMSDYEVQTVIISGTPTSGDYVLVYTSADSDVQTTTPLDYDAAGATVQSALRKLEGLENVTVATTGTSPNFTHTITFEKMDPPGNIGNLSSSDTFDTGSIAHAESTAATAHVYKDKALIFDSDGAELTSIKQRVDGSLSARTSYAVCAWMKVDAYPAAGVIKIDLVDGAGTVVANVQGVDNSITINPLSGQDLSTSAFTAITGFFQTPTVIPEIVYLRIKITTAISNTASLYIDEVSLVKATPLYTGGPLVAMFAGTTPPGIRDKWTITVSNALGGEFQTWFYRCFGYADFLLPSNNAAGETIDDATLIS